MSSEQVETPAEFCEWLVSMNALSNVGSRGLVTLGNIIERADLALRAANHAPFARVLAGDTEPGCTGDYECLAPPHQHGCMADTEGHCNEPEAHHASDVLAEVRAAFNRCGVIGRAGLDTQPSYSPMRQSAIERADRLWFDLNAILDREATQ